MVKRGFTLEEEAGVAGVPSFLGFDDEVSNERIIGCYQIFKNKWLSLNGEFTPSLRSIWLKFNNCEILYAIDKWSDINHIGQYKEPNSYKSLRDFLPISCLGENFIREFKTGIWRNFDAYEIDVPNVGKLILSHSYYYHQPMVNVLFKFNSNHYHARGILGQTLRKSNHRSFETHQLPFLF